MANGDFLQSLGWRYADLREKDRQRQIRTMLAQRRLELDAALQEAAARNEPLETRQRMAEQGQREMNNFLLAQARPEQRPRGIGGFLSRMFDLPMERGLVPEQEGLLAQSQAGQFSQQPRQGQLGSLLSPQDQAGLELSQANVGYAQSRIPTPEERQAALDYRAAQAERERARAQYDREGRQSGGRQTSPADYETALIMRKRNYIDSEGNVFNPEGLKNDRLIPLYEQQLQALLGGGTVMPQGPAAPAPKRVQSSSLATGEQFVNGRPTGYTAPEFPGQARRPAAPAPSPQMAAPPVQQQQPPAQQQTAPATPRLEQGAPAGANFTPLPEPKIVASTSPQINAPAPVFSGAQSRKIRMVGPDNQLYEFDEQYREEAQRRGYRPRRVRMADPNGMLYDVDEDESAEALSYGWRLR